MRGRGGHSQNYSRSQGRWRSGQIYMRREVVDLPGDNKGSTLALEIRSYSEKLEIKLFSLPAHTPMGQSWMLD